MTVTISEKIIGFVTLLTLIEYSLIFLLVQSAPTLNKSQETYLRIAIKAFRIMKIAPAKIMQSASL